MIMAKTPKSSEPFVAETDRPTIHPDTPIGELRVRDLQTIFAGGAQAKFIDKTHKDIEKIIKDHDKHFKDWKEIEKIVKDADNKHLKDLIDQIIVKTVPDTGPDPTKPIGGDPITQLQNMVGQLANEVAQLKAKAGKS
jgi:hypothetical protein